MSYIVKSTKLYCTVLKYATQHKPSPLQHPQYHLEHNPSSPLHAQEQHHPQHQSRELNNDCLGQGGILFW